MSHDQEDIKQEIEFLKMLADFHRRTKQKTWANDEKGFEEHINAILDEINLLRKELEKFE